MKEWLEHACTHRLIHASAGVADTQARVPTAAAAGARLEKCLIQVNTRRFEAKPSALGHGVASVSGKIEDQLLDKSRVGLNRWEVWIERTLKDDLRTEEPCNRGHEIHEEPVEVE